MIIIGDTLVSEDIFDRSFHCQLDKCKGACCVLGDRGAPLEESEIEQIQQHLPGIKDQMSPEGIKLLNEKGFWETDPNDGELVTTCLPDGACVFVKYEGSITSCAIEKAYLKGDSSFKKPVSCHLYPIRTARYGEYTILNYHNWDICKPACDFGKSKDITVFGFLKEALIRKFGEEWYTEAEQVLSDWKDQNKS